VNPLRAGGGRASVRLAGSQGLPTLPAGFRRSAVIAAISRCSPRILVRDLSLRYVTCLGQRVRDPEPEAQSFVTSPLSPRYDPVRVYCVLSGASTTRTSLDVEVDCMPDRHRSAWRRCRPRDQVDRGLIATLQGWEAASPGGTTVVRAKPHDPIPAFSRLQSGARRHTEYPLMTWRWIACRGGIGPRGIGRGAL
jgi:hypothetical protein